MDAQAQGTHLYGATPGFFYEPLPDITFTGTGAGQRGGGSMFTHTSRRYRMGWDAGKLDHEDE